MINPPPTRSALVDEKGMIKQEWQEFFSAAFFSLQAQESSGTTAKRPTKNLFIGRPYFDTSLGYAIHYNGVAWVNWAGVIV